MKLSKNKKIILLTSGIGILTTSIVVPIVMLNNKEDQIKKVEEDIPKIEIKSKIKNKDLIISKDIKTFSDDEILLAIKNQLKINNPTLTNEDLSKITDNVQHLKPGKKTFVVLKINSNGLTSSIKVNVTKEKNIKLWTKDSAIVKNSNIYNGGLSSFIQDSSGNLWSMGDEGQRRKSWIAHKPTKLQVLKRDGKQWEEDITSGLTKGSNIINGTNGVIFEDDFGNIWSMGKETKLQVLVKNKDDTFAESWANDNGEGGEKLLQGSKINNGDGGFIFQDFFGNLWAMGKSSKLQVLVKNKDGNYASSWESNNIISKKLLKNSNITKGHWGQIFQDSFKNLWTMGENSKLQVLKAKENGEDYVSEGWINDNGEDGDKLLKNSKINRGKSGTIFQDSFGNLWAMGNGSKLQVLKKDPNKENYVETGWTSDTTLGLTKGSNIRDGWGGTIFQDSFGNLWAQGYGKKPQVLKATENSKAYVTQGWNNNSSQEGLLKNLKSNNNKNWFFFQDSSKNLWAAGSETKLQVLKVNENGLYVNSWANDNSKNGEILLRGSNITAGEVLVFEDTSKNLWAIGKIWNVNSHNIRKLQVYDKTLKKWKS